MTFLGLVGIWLAGKLIDALLDDVPSLFSTPASPAVGPPRGAGGRRPRRVVVPNVPQERPPGPAQGAPAGTAATPATMRASVPPSTAPWPQVEARDLPAFPGPGWEPDHPPSSAVIQRANTLLPILWAQTPAGRERGFVKIEQIAGRWIAFQATLMGGRVKGVVAYRLRGQGVRPHSVPQSAPSGQGGRVTTLPEVLITASPPSDTRPASTTPMGSAVSLPTLRQGSRGPDVQLLQRHLGVTPDGAFGPKTASAVVAYQRAHGLVPDGIVGPKTWGSLLGAGQAA